MKHPLLYLIWEALPLGMVRFVRKQKQLIARRGGIKAHIQLTAVFHEIGEDKYVKQYREKNKR